MLALFSLCITSAVAGGWNSGDLQDAEPMFRAAFTRAVAGPDSAPIRIHHARNGGVQARFVAMVDGGAVLALDQTALATDPWVHGRVVNDPLLFDAAESYLLDNGLFDHVGAEAVQDFIEEGYTQYNEDLFGLVYVDNYDAVQGDWLMGAMMEDLEQILQSAILYSVMDDIVAAGDVLETLFGLGDAADSVNDAINGEVDDLTGMFDDLDGDGTANWLDPDDDGDGVPDEDDEFPHDSTRSCFPPIWYLTPEAQFTSFVGADGADLAALVQVAMEQQQVWTWTGAQGSWVQYQ